MNVTAVVVTRGDVDLQPVLASLPAEWPVVIWDNSEREDLAVYGRYAALGEVATGRVYVQDDDCIVSDPQAIVDAWEPGHVVCNMPERFRHAFYEDHSLVGFGACFERDLPERAFSRFALSSHANGCIVWGAEGQTTALFDRTCDVVFTALTPRILVDVPHADREFASDPTRMWTQKDHVGERARMLELALKVRAA